MIRKTKETKKLAQDLMKESAQEEAKLLTSSLKDKALENPSEDNVLMEKTLRVEATTKDILKDAERTFGASESQALKVTMEEDIFVEATIVIEASDVVETSVYHSI